jgi:hypothetical protein
MFAQTARNYAAADAASTAGVRRRIDDDLAALPRVGSYVLPTCYISAVGGSGDTPPGWELIAHAVGWSWPNGHQDRLRTAASAWRASAAAFGDAAGQVIDASAMAISDRLPEAEDIWRVCAALARQLDELGDVHSALADACEGLAEHIDAAHHAVIAELRSLLEWTAGIEAAGALLAIGTFGISEAASQVGEATRLSVTATRIAAIIERFTALAQDLAAPVARLAERADRVAGTMTGLLDVRLSMAVVEHVRTLPSMLRMQELLAVRRLGALAGDFPELRMSTAQLEAKFKHAKVFGITLPRGRAGFQAFDDAVHNFLTSRSTRRVIGTYRRRTVILNYQIKTRLIVIQDLDGTFTSAWRLRQAALFHVVRDRSLGGG